MDFVKFIAETLQQYPAIWGALLVGSGVNAFFWFGEWWINDITRKDIANWIERPFEPGNGIIETFLSLLDDVFGENHLTWKCFRRSALISILPVSVFSFSWLFSYGVNFPQRDPFHFHHDSSKFLAFFLATGGIFFNTIPDYLSLLQTRIFLRFLLDKSHIPSVVIAALMWDIIFTAIVFAICTFTVLEITVFFLTIGETPLNTTPFHAAIQTLTLSEINGVTPFYITTFSTSIWLWLYGLSLLFLRMTTPFNAIRKFVLRSRYREAPLKMMGPLAGSFAGLLALPLFLL